MQEKKLAGRIGFASFTLLQTLLEPVPESVPFLGIVDVPAQATCHVVNRKARAGTQIVRGSKPGL
jgi:hypothetical protein